MGRRIVWGLLVAALSCASAPFSVTTEAAGAGAPGSVISSEPAQVYAQLPHAARTHAVRYRSRSILDAPIDVTGTVAIPFGDPPPGGWPIVSWAHVTTGAADNCAPSAATPDNPEWEKLTRGDEIVDMLLENGIAVARTDYEGVGGDGPHPYLIGKSLARSQTEIVRTARELEPTIGTRWAAAGHSEGGVSSIFSAQYASQFAPELELVAVSSLSPPIGTHLILDVARRIPTTFPSSGGLTSLAGLIVGGALASDPILKRQALNGALSEKAIALLPHIEQRCHIEMSLPDSWGGLAPSEIVGPKFRAASKRFYAILDANDPLAARLGKTPVRIDQGLLDVVASDPAARWFTFTQRLRGANVTYKMYPTGTHMNISDREYAAPNVVDWLRAKFR